MYEKIDSNGFLNSEYCDNVELFLDFAFSKEDVVDTRVNMHGETARDIKCPCYKCQNINYRDRATVQNHLFKYGFMLRYEIWSEHGEKSNHDVGQSSTTMEIDDDDDDDGCKRMVLDNLCSCDYTSSTLEGCVPNPEAKRFYDMLEAADEPLWEGEKATSFSKLQAATSFLTWKSLFNVSIAAYNFNLSMINALLPENNKLPKTFYDTKKSLEPLSLPYERIDVCKNHCMIFYKQDKALTRCKYCKESRYKSVLNKVPNLVMWYMPIGPRLKRLYMSTKTAKDMTWHHDHKTIEGSMAHPSDGMAWKHFDSENPDFAKEIRNVRLGLCTDGFNPNNSHSIPYSLWPVFLTIYNLPPWMSMKDSFVQVSLIIPGGKSPGQNIDVFLRPLIDELKELYGEGIEVYDAYRKENFIMRVILLWTVSDFPAYAMLSGWSTHGRLACPYCMGDTDAFRLHAGGKTSWFDCHRRFLPMSHPFRIDIDGFRRSTSSLVGPPPELTGWEILEQVSNIPVVYEGVTPPKHKDPKFGKTHN
uniref:Putative transposon, En/Spm-like, Transposase-associated domain protein n=2 Tax=Helianthus annuus TaxID=4232 RepID=A0A251V5A0_HELAN